jgi:hypothetical protein
MNIRCENDVCYLVRDPVEIVFKFASRRINGGGAEELIQSTIQFYVIQEREPAGRVCGGNKVAVELSLH